MSRLFQVRSENLDHLGPDKSVELIRKLVWADATASGIGKAIVNIPTAITVGDGGIDGEVGEIEQDSKYKIIRKGITRYQIKSGKFTLCESDIRSILFKNNSSELKERIKHCLDSKGTLVIVFTGWDNPDQIEEQASNRFKEKLAEVSEEYRAAKIEIWRQNTVIGLLDNFLSLKLDILGTTYDSFYCHEEWTRLADMKPVAYLGAGQIKFIDDIRRELRMDDRPIHIRVIGEPGVGKTRLVLEATSVDDLQHCTIYVEDPTKLEKMSFMDQISRIDDESNVILVVDECSYDDQAAIWNRLQDKSPSIKLITIFNEPDQSSGTTAIMSVPGLGNEEIGKIIKWYGIADSEASKWVGWCGQSPRAAHILGQNLKENPEDILRSPDTIPVWNRYIAGRTRLDSTEFSNRLTILLWLSLFKKFGFGSSFAKEADQIAKIVENRMRIPSGTFYATVNKLKQMKILQGHATLYITPKILHVYLWTQWWERYGANIFPKMGELVTSEERMRSSVNLVQWCFDMFEYASRSPQAQAAVRDLLKEGEFLGGNGDLGPGFFLILSKTDPSSALDYLENTIGNKSRGELVGFRSGRREVVAALEYIAAFAKNFEGATNILLMLADAENESFANNATGIFVSLFVPGQGSVATTEVAPKNRIPALRRAIYSDSKYKRSVGIKACGAALTTAYFSKVVYDQNEIVKRPNLWKAETDEEIIEYYQRILDILVEQLDRNDECKNEATSVILDKLRSLMIIPKMTEKALEITKQLHESHIVDSETLLGTITYIVDFETDTLDPKVLAKLQELQNDIAGTDFHSLMKRYVGMDIMVDLGKYTKNRGELRKKEIDKLATRSLDLGNLKPELKWLVTGEAKYGLVFGYELAKKDSAYKLMPAILDALRNAKGKGSGFFVSGYFSHMRENSAERWEGELDRLYNDPTLCRFVPEITWRSGITDMAAERIIHGINEHRFDYTSLRIFVYGSMRDRLSEKIFTKLVELLLEEKAADATFIAIELFYSYFIPKQQRTLPRQLTLKLLLHQNIVHKSPQAVNPIHGTYWKEIGLAFVNQYPNDSTRIAKTVIENFDTKGFFAYHNSELIQVLNEIVKINPREVWAIASRYVGPPIDSRAYSIRQWLRSGAMDIIPMSDIIAWINEDEKSRLSYVASFLPPEFEKIREFLTIYGGYREVQRYLSMNFDTESWTGSETTHYEKKKKWFEELKEKETDANVLSWLNYYIESLDYHIKRSMDHEEREF